MSAATVAGGLVRGPDSNAIGLGVASGTVRACFQALPGGDWTGWGPLADAPVPFLNTAADGRQGDALVAVAVGTDGSLYCVESPADSGWSASWTEVGHPPETNLSAGCAVAAASTGTVLVAVGGDGNLWTVNRPTGQSWSGWTDLGAPAAGVSLLGDCAVTTVSGSAVLAVAVGADGQLHTISGTPPSGWGGWQCAGHPPSTSVSGPVAVAPAPGGQATVFTVGTDGHGYTAPVGGSPGQFTPVGNPADAALLTGDTVTAGLLAGPLGGLTVLAPAVDGLAYCLQLPAGAWAPLDEPGGELPLRSVTGTGTQMYAACVAAPAAAEQAAAPVPNLRLDTIVTSDTVSLQVPPASGFLLAAVQDAEGTPVPGVGLTVVRPDGSPVDTPSPPNATGSVIDMANGLVTSMLQLAPQSGVWTATVQGADDSDEDFQVTLTTLPVFDAQATIEATLRQMCDSENAPSAEDSSWGCAACQFGGYAGAVLIAAAIAYGVATLAPESAVVIWLAGLTGITQEDALSFIVNLGSQGITAVPDIVAAICRMTGSCS
ncbi:hypothetical protein MUU72_33790 [Streptomyces sp. RS10V-4]|uniref:hypothetical protein n=1 Tax=Streptomyces rhizoryzae TaxID=2932493 RepID=UPI002003D48E|nr:hypothetical protein [Streptomyces rhizoryzae]MCK7628003.1 hypothetical protein [Streptomyces rhizoryzae]